MWGNTRKYSQIYKLIIVVCKQSWHNSFMNIVTVYFHNISKDLDFKPDDNCVSPLGQTGRVQKRINFMVMAVEIRPGAVV